MNNIDKARRAVGSHGRFPVSSKICFSMPMCGLDSIASVRIFIALMWIAETTAPKKGADGIAVSVDELRLASGYQGRPYRDILAGVRDLRTAALLLTTGEVVEVFEFLYITDHEGDRFCYFSFTSDFVALQASFSEDGYGTIDIEEVTRLARAIDLPLYLRAAAVRKRKHMSFELSREDVFCLAGVDPDESIGGALRAVRVAMQRVSAIMKLTATTANSMSIGGSRVLAVAVAVNTLKEV